MPTELRIHDAPFFASQPSFLLIFHLFPGSSPPGTDPHRTERLPCGGFYNNLVPKYYINVLYPDPLPYRVR